MIRFPKLLSGATKYLPSGLTSLFGGGRTNGSSGASSSTTSVVSSGPTIPLPDSSGKIALIQRANEVPMHPCELLPRNIEVIPEVSSRNFLTDITVSLKRDAKMMIDYYQSHLDSNEVDDEVATVIREEINKREKWISDIEKLPNRIFGLECCEPWELIRLKAIPKIAAHVQNQIGYLDSHWYLSGSDTDFNLSYLQDFKEDSGQKREALLEQFGKEDDLDRYQRYLCAYAYRLSKVSRLLARQFIIRASRHFGINDKDLISFSLKQIGTYESDGNLPFDRAKKLKELPIPRLATLMQDGQRGYCTVMREILAENLEDNEAQLLKEFNSEFLQKSPRVDKAQIMDAFLMLSGKAPHEESYEERPPYIGELVSIYADEHPNRLSELLDKVQIETQDSAFRMIGDRHSIIDVKILASTPIRQINNPPTQATGSFHGAQNEFVSEDLLSSGEIPIGKTALGQAEIGDSPVSFKVVAQDTGAVDRGEEGPTTGELRQSDLIQEVFELQADKVTTEQIFQKSHELAVKWCKELFEVECATVSLLEDEVMQVKLREELEAQQLQALQEQASEAEENAKQVEAIGRRMFIWKVGGGIVATSAVLVIIGGVAYWYNWANDIERIYFQEMLPDAVKSMEGVAYPGEVFDSKEPTINGPNFRLRLDYMLLLNSRYFRFIEAMMDPNISEEVAMKGDVPDDLKPYFGFIRSELSTRFTSEEWKGMGSIVGDSVLLDNRTHGLAANWLIPTLSYWIKRDSNGVIMKDENNKPIMNTPLSMDEHMRNVFIKQEGREPVGDEHHPKNFVVKYDKGFRKTVDVVEGLSRVVEEKRIEVIQRYNEASNEDEKKLLILLKAVAMLECRLNDLKIKLEQRREQIIANNSYTAPMK